MKPKKIKEQQEKAKAETEVILAVYNQHKKVTEFVDSVADEARCEWGLNVLGHGIWNLKREIETYQSESQQFVLKPITSEVWLRAFAKAGLERYFSLRIERGGFDYLEDEWEVELELVSKLGFNLVVETVQLEDSEIPIIGYSEMSAIGELREITGADSVSFGFSKPKLTGVEFHPENLMI